jgi:hypothetical protein
MFTQGIESMLVDYINAEEEYKSFKKYLYNNFDKKEDFEIRILS